MVIIPSAHSTVVCDKFLSSTGLNQVTELIYLDSTRPWALKVFETLILSGSDHQKDAALHELAEAEDHDSHAKGGGPQSFCKFYEDLNEACLNWKGKNRMSAEIRWNHDGAYLNIINLFLCVAFLCVCKENCDKDSATNFEDPSGYYNTANEPLGEWLPFFLPGSLELPSKEQVKRAADVWSVSHRLYMENPVFQRQLFRLGGLNMCSRLITIVLQNLTLKTKEIEREKNRDSKCKESLLRTGSDSSALTPVHTAYEAIVFGTHKTQQLDHTNSLSPGHMVVTSKVPEHKLEEEWALQSIRLLEALLSICLHSAKSVLKEPESNISIQVFIMQHFLN